MREDQPADRHPPERASARRGLAGGDGIDRVGTSRPPRRGVRRSKVAGKHALFSVADADSTRRMSGADVAAGMGAGKQALFSTRNAPFGTAKIECSTCGRTTRVNLLELLAARLPLSLWLPFRSYDHLMRCPACGKLAWCRMSLFS